MKKILSFLFLLLFLQARAQPLKVAVAANAQYVVKQLQADFTKRTGIEIEVIIGSSGKLAAQIRNGAPFHLFLSADMAFPESLLKEGHGASAVKEYAAGKLILCSTTEPELRNWKSLFAKEGSGKIAVANPELAPYGKAAEETLRYYKLWDKIQPRIVSGESIAQVNTYIGSGTVPFAFTTESLVYEYPGKTKLYWTRIDPRSYQKIRQGMVVLTYAKTHNYQNALRFFNYLSSAAAKKLLNQNGYNVP